MKSKKLWVLLAFSAVALGLRLLERLIPLPSMLPGDTLGLAHLVTLLAVFLLPWEDAALILTVRVVLASLWLGFTDFLFSAGGGLCALLAAAGMKKLLPETQVWIAGILSALAHSVGQLAVAALLRQSPYLLLYVPVLPVISLVTGAVLGLCAQGLLIRGKKLWKTILE